MSEMLPALVAFSAVMSFTPGPNNVLVTSSGASFGFRRSLPLVMGIGLGFALMVALVGAGASAMFQTFPSLHPALKVLGTLYLLWLAWRIARPGRAAGAGSRARPLSFLEGAAFQWINPKGWIFVAGAFSAFTVVGDHPVGGVALMSAVMGGACLAAVATWCAFGVAIGRLLTSERALAVFNWSMAALLAASIAAAWM